MSPKRSLPVLFILAVFAFGFAAGRFIYPQGETVAQAESQGRVFELRTYTTNEGKLDALQSRFRNHTMKLFERHGITNIGYWVPDDAPLKQNTLIYIVAHPSREAAKKNWAAIGNDPEWRKVRAESEGAGQFASKIDSVYMEATDYSPLK